MHSMAGGRFLQACLVIVYRYRSVNFKQGIVVDVVFGGAVLETDTCKGVSSGDNM